MSTSSPMSQSPRSESGDPSAAGAPAVSVTGSFSIDDDSNSSRDASPDEPSGVADQSQESRPSSKQGSPVTPKRGVKSSPRASVSATADRDTPSARLAPAVSAEEPALPTWAARAWQLRAAPTVADAAAAAAAANGTDTRSSAPTDGRQPAAGTAAARVAAQREKAPLRKGKWTVEEEMFTTSVIREFERGMLACPPGTTLRSYLSEKLHCDPMRITKKFAGDASIGKRVFTPCKQTPENLAEARRVRAELADTERRFAAHLQHASLAYAASAAMRAGGGRGRSGSLGSSSRRGGSSRLDVSRPIGVTADGTLVQHARRPASKRGRDDAAARASQQQDSQLLLDFFVAVQERCTSETAAPPAAADASETKERSDSCATRASCPSPTPLPDPAAPDAAAADGAADRNRQVAMRC